MKHRVSLVLMAALGLFASADAQADDLFQLFWRGTYYTRNSTGHIVALNFTEQDLVNQVAQSAGMDASQLILVYRPDKRDAAVVQSNGALVASFIQMQNTFTDVVNPNGTVIVRHALLTDDAHSDALGSFFGTEQRTVSAGGRLVNDKLVGTVLYALPGTLLVYSAKVFTGGRITDTTNAP
jgi:hypothetical protein